MGRIEQNERDIRNALDIEMFYIFAMNRGGISAGVNFGFDTEKLEVGKIYELSSANDFFVTLFQG